MVEAIGAAAAVARKLRVSPQKLNVVAGLIRGKKVDNALADLEFSRKRIQFVGHPRNIRLQRFGFSSPRSLGGAVVSSGKAQVFGLLQQLESGQASGVQLVSGTVL